MTNGQSTRVHWSNRFVFILAAAGSAVGLGNIWKFPYIAGVNGGGAFVLIYLFCIGLIGIPIFIAELYIGQRSQTNAIQAFEVLTRKGSPWKLIGVLGVAGSFLILSFYSVVGGWVLDFSYRALMDQFSGLSEDEVKGLLGSLFHNPYRQLIWHFIFLAVTVAIVMGGIKKGIERWSKILMPALFVLLLYLLIKVFFLSGFGRSLDFLFSLHADQLTAEGILEAVGHSFFTLSLGMGIMITYGSYLSQKENVVKVAIAVSIMDTAVALIAGIVMFAVVFTFGFQPGKGPTLMFQTLPMLFAKMDGGYFVAIAFFLLVAFAAFTSAISLMEVVVTYWEEKKQRSRKIATVSIGMVLFLFGILSALSTNVLSDFKIMGLTFFDLIDKTTSHIFLPLGGLLISIFYGWVLGPRAIEATVGAKLHYRILGVCLLWIVRIIAPVGVGITMINSLINW